MAQLRPNKNLRDFAVEALSSKEKMGNMRVSTFPPELREMYEKLLEEISKGNPVELDRIKEAYTTQEAGDFLNVSKPYLVENLLKKGKITFHKVGNRMRVTKEDLLKYKNLRDSRAEQLLNELSEDAQDMEMY